LHNTALKLDANDHCNQISENSVN